MNFEWKVQADGWDETDPLYHADEASDRLGTYK